LENMINKTLQARRIPTGYSDILDVEMALSLYEGDTAFLNELLSLFRNSKPSEMARLKEILFNAVIPTDDVYKSAKLIAHSIKGDAAAIGAVKLQAVCQTLESHIIDRDIDLAKQLWDKFETEFKRVVNIIKE